ncbi:CDP-diacylglycerol--serine O-phosphatidyltransferase [Paludibacterium paludis]|uniref:CDP-diacylglycerol--serine O-phosphatidyltransferase n=1 Tax=Paludibacterium paludis TaxID=1225769 RepID=A0A918NWF6_9NEIS|nr:CDP-diacylglycerol--serine O-phosphatidyltransferase [Paludibacterium paludis]GGY01957.1 CDP-diacylglycerol--serine O-phosphatidyltransferase [Paludibacterium paludis]
MPQILLRPQLDQLPAFGLKTGDVTTLMSAEDFRARLLEAIGQARERICLTALYLQDDEAGHQVMDALVDAARRNPELAISVVVDWHRGQRGLIGAARNDGNAAWYREVCEAHGGIVPVYGVPAQTRELFGVLHLKGFVIDNSVIYSGASLNNVYLGWRGRYRFDRYHIIECAALADSMYDLVQRHIIGNPAVHRLDLPNPPATKAIRREIKEFRANLVKLRYDTSGATALPGTLSVTPLIGVGKNNPLNRQVCQLLASATRRVVICTPYFNFPRPVSREIGRLLRRGVTVDIIVGDKTANDFFIPPDEPFKAIGALPYLYEINLRRFAKRHEKFIADGSLNLHLWKHGDNSYHLKGILVDDRYTLITGNNLNPRAFRLDLENALLFRDPHGELSAQNEAELANILTHCRKVERAGDLESVRHYPEPVKKLISRLSRVRVDRLLYRIL